MPDIDDVNTSATSLCTPIKLPTFLLHLPAAILETFRPGSCGPAERWQVIKRLQTKSKYLSFLCKVKVASAGELGGEDRGEGELIYWRHL